MSDKNIKKTTFFIKGMHCSSCELLIEQEILKFKNIKKVKASTTSNKLEIHYLEKPLSLKQLNKMFKSHGYQFLKSEPKDENNNNKADSGFNNIVVPASVAFVIILLFYIISRSGLTSLLSVNTTSGLATFFIFGLLAGFSTCSALLGGLILSLSKSWTKTAQSGSRTNPSLLFIFGRIISFTLLGLLLGFIGQSLQISTAFTSILTITISALMLILGLQMLGVKPVQKIKISLPKSLSKIPLKKSKFKGSLMPLSFGFLTFLLPCGFTITTQGLALLSANPWQSGLIMLSFVLGTTPALYLIGQTSLKINQNPGLNQKFLKTAGILVLVFSLYTINSQLNVLGLKSLTDILSKPVIKASNDGFAPIINGKQVLNMKATSFSYEPNVFKVKPNIPVRWEITDNGVSGCTNAVIARDLFSGQIKIKPGQTSIKEFTPTKAGEYKFSCWMGMVSGTIYVADNNNNTQINYNPAKNLNNNGCKGGENCQGSCGGSCSNPSCAYTN
jgi:uncharacterized protein